MPDLRRIGREHEDRAARHLLGLGYTIVTRRFVAKGGEVDIVALDGETLVFVEVKFRRDGDPEAAVGDTKVARFTAAVEDYLAKTGSHKRPCRFDLIAVTETELRHYPGAFRAP